MKIKNAFKIGIILSIFALTAVISTASPFSQSIHAIHVGNSVSVTVPTTPMLQDKYTAPGFTYVSTTLSIVSGITYETFHFKDVKTGLQKIVISNMNTGKVVGTWTYHVST